MTEKLRNGYPYVPKEQRKTILLLSDDMQVTSGVGTMSREIVLGTCHHYNWVQLGAAINHPYKGQIIDMNEAITKETGVEDPSVKIYPFEGYGNAQILNHLILTEKPDCILHFTDPRQFIWLYLLEHEIRQHIPIVYYTIWDAPPTPMYNIPFYLSTDLHIAISKQTQNLIKLAVKDKMNHDNIVYVPHGIDPDKFYQMDYDKSYIAMDNLYYEIFGDKQFDFIALYHNRNMRRKNPGDLILGFKHFISTLSPEEASKCALLFHTDPIDDNGTNLIAIAEDLAPECNIIFYAKKLPTKDLCTLYNIVDVTCNIACAEGFGLSNAESMMCGTPTIATVTGGLQDQMGFVDDNKNPIEFNETFTTNHAATYRNHGDWVYPIFPSVHHLTGSVVTPYIFEDYIHFKDLSEAFQHWHGLPADVRKSFGAQGRVWMMQEHIKMTTFHMCNGIMSNIDKLLSEWTPTPKYTLSLHTNQIPSNTGIIF